jgi:hypothetical protein
MAGGGDGGRARCLCMKRNVRGIVYRCGNTEINPVQVGRKARRISVASHPERRGRI